MAIEPPILIFFSGDVKKMITEYRRSNHLHPVDTHKHKSTKTVRAEMKSRGAHFWLRTLRTFPSLLLAIRQGGRMSMYKQNDEWRSNEPSRSVQYFDCRLGKILESKRGWSQSKLARLLNVSPTTVNSWVKGTNIPPSDVQEMIAHVLGFNSRAEIWVYKNGTEILPLVLKMNRLTVELDETETMIHRKLHNGNGRRKVPA